MKSSLALLAAAGTASAVVTSVKMVVEVVTVTVTADPTDFVQASKPTPTPEVVSTPSAAPSPPPAPPAANAAAAEEPVTTTEAPAPPPTSTSEPEPVVQTPQPEPEPETTTTTQPPQSVTLGPSGSYQETAVKYHNALRADHSASALAWDDELAQWAQNTASKCVFEHDMKQGDGVLAYGQNLASLGATGDLGTTESAVGKAIKDQWYDKEEPLFQNFYGQSSIPSNVFSQLGHYTQLVWKQTVKVGCSTVHCPAGSVLSFPSYFTVCNYSPPGNYDGQYGSNVSPSLGIKVSL